MLEVKGLTKCYGTKTALNEVGFSLEDGIYGLLGPNGAGKSTMMNLLTLNLEPTAGEILWDGTPIREMKKAYRGMLGYMPQQQSLYPGFTAWEYLDYMGSLRGVRGKDAKRDILTVLERVELASVRNEKIKTFSGGMKQRLMLAQAVFTKPRVLILDEPTAGLDPRQRVAIRNLISELAQQSVVLIATHVVPDVEFISREILLLKEGTLLRKASPSALCEELYGRVFECAVPGEKVRALMKERLVSSIRQESETVWVARMVGKPEEQPSAVLVRPTLEDVYLSFFGRSDHGEADLL